MKENPSCHGVHLLWEAWLNTDMLGSTGPTPASQSHPPAGPVSLASGGLVFLYPALASWEAPHPAFQRGLRRRRDAA